MFLPSTITTGLLASAITSTVPFPAPTAPPPRILADTLLKRDSTSNPYSWENSHSWHTDASSSAFVCGSPLACATNTDNIIACTMDQDPPESFHTTCLNLEDYRSRKCSSTDLKALCCGESSAMGDCASIFWTGSPTRSMFTCDSTGTVISLLDEPAYIAVMSTSSDMTSSESTSSQKPSSESTTSKSTSSLISRSSLPPSTGSTVAPSSSSTTTESTSHSSKKSTSSSSSSTSSSKASPSTRTSSSSSSAVSSDAATANPDSSSTSSREASPTSSQPSVAPVVTSQTNTMVETTTSSPAPTYSVGVPTSPPTDTSGLSTAAKAGIGAGAGAGLLLLLTGVALVLFRKRKARDEPVQHNTWPRVPDLDHPGGPATQQAVDPPRRALWHRGPRGPRGPAAEAEADVADELLDPGVGGSEVPVDTMRGRGHPGGAEPDGGEALGLAPPRRDPARDSWRRSYRHPSSTSSGAASPGWPGRGAAGEAPEDHEAPLGDRQPPHGLAPGVPRPASRRRSDWRGSDGAWSGAF